MASNNSTYPTSAVQTKNFPTCALGVVSKYDPASKFREEEEIMNEFGTVSYIVGVDQMNEVEVEIVLFPNSNIPTALTMIPFNYANVNNGGNINYLVRGDIKVSGMAGKAKRVSFKMMNNSALP